MNVELYEHQCSAIHLLEQHESNKEVKLDEHMIIECNIGIFSDPAGYGKTLSMIGMISRDRMPFYTNHPYLHRSLDAYYSHGILAQYDTRVLTRIDSTLILVSPSILNQWIKELNKSKLKYYIVRSRQNVFSLKAEQFDVVVCVHSMYNYIIDKYFHFCWKRFVFDDPITIPGMCPIIAGFYWFITHNPHSLTTTQNKRTENFYNSIFSLYIERQVWNHIIIKNSRETLDSSYTMQPITNLYYECYQHTSGVFFNEYILTMINDGNIAGVINFIGGQQTNNIIELLKTRYSNNIDEINSNLSNTTNADSIRELSLQHSRFKDKIEMLDEKCVNMLSENCVICMCSMTKPVMVSDCQHIFCGVCIMTWLKNKNYCPMCRSTIQLENLIYIDKTDSSVSVHPPTKSKKLIDIISKNIDNKYIIFSAFLDTIHVIRHTLSENDIQFIEIKGRATTRERQIKTFRNGKVNVLFLNSRDKCAGLDLEFATDIIIYHQMDDNIKSQIISRAHRIGRTSPLNIHYLV